MNSTKFYLGLSENGEVVPATDANQKHNYTCPLCLKAINQFESDSGLFFSHTNEESKCTANRIHKKALTNELSKNLQESLDKKEKFPIKWDCLDCSGTHSGDLLKKAASISTTHKIGGFKPDFTLLDQEEKIFAVLVIVVANKPPKKVREKLRSEKIILVEIPAKTEEQIISFREKYHKPNVSFCSNPICKNCRGYKTKLIMTIIDGDCWNCGKLMKVASIRSQSNAMLRNRSNHIGPSDFLEGEIQLARQNGVIIKEQFSKTVQSSYMANTCGACGNFAGNHFLFTEYVAPAAYGDLNSTEHTLGYVCGRCENEKSKSDWS